MIDPVGLLGLVLTLGAMGAGAPLLRRAFVQRRARDRVGGGKPADAQTRRAKMGPPAIVRWLPLPAAAISASVGSVWTAQPLLWSGVGVLMGALVHVAVHAMEQRRALAMEDGLAEAIGLASAALRAGASPLEALERASQAISGPARVLLLEMTGRLRLGESPEVALAELAEDVPLESYRLFSVALGVQWRAGGSLERSLVSVAGALRDRVELLRRIQTQSAPTRGSVFVFVVATLGIALLMWQNNPANFEHFLRSDGGSLLVGGAVWLQGIGIVWMSRLSRIEA
jgi:tight adherence protein B